MSIASTLSLLLAVGYFLGWIFVWLLHVVALTYGKWKLHRISSVTPDAESPQGVSIIKPLYGVDANLKSNLDTFFHLNYPAYEILFSVHDENDPAVLLVQNLMKIYPNVDAKLFIGVPASGQDIVNGKIKNMLKAYQASKYDIILISDSGIRMDVSTLAVMMNTMKPDIGMVYQMPYTCDRDGFASVYEKVFFGTYFARNCLNANAMGINCSSGSSCLMRKEILEGSGGMEAFGKYLNEDYFLEMATRDRGFKSKLCPKPAMLNSGICSVKDFHKRLTRWCHNRFAMLPTLIFFEPNSECMLMGILGSLSISYLFNVSALVVFLLHLLCWFMFDYALITTVENGPMKFSKFEFLVAWAMRELLVSYIYMQSMRSHKVTWHKKTYKIEWGGTAQEIREEVV